MTRKLAIVFAVLALSYIASATVDSNSPASVFAVTPGKLFTNGTDTAFTSLTGGCMFTGGFDNTTNYVWCLTAYPSSTVAYTFQRRAINASSPATINSTADTKIATTHYAQTNGMAMCSGAGYLGLATGYGTGTSPTYKSDVSFSFAAVNGSSFTKVALTSNSDANMINAAQECFYDNGIFYIIYTSYHYCQSGSEGGSCTSNKTQNAVYIQGVNVTSGAVYYNSTGGVKLWSPTSQTMSTLSFLKFVGNNQTGYATQGLLLYTDSSAATSTVGSKYNLLPITLSTGAAGSVQTLATGAQATGTASSSSTWSSTATSYPSSSTAESTFTTSITTYLPQTDAATSSEISITASAGSIVTTGTIISGTSTQYLTTSYASAATYTSYTTTSTSTSTTSTVVTSTYYSTSTSYASAAVTDTLTSTVSTVYSMSAFGSLSTYGVVLVQDVDTYTPQITLTHSHVYTNSLYINGSSTASTAANLTNPSGYYLTDVHGFATTDGGYCLIETFASTTSGAADAVYKDTYYYNGTQTTTSVSLGTYQSDVQPFADATGSIWLGYTVNDDANSSYPLVSAYAGEVLYQNLSASTLSSIFATLAIMIAALFAF